MARHFPEKKPPASKIYPEAITHTKADDIWRQAVLPLAGRLAAALCQRFCSRRYAPRSVAKLCAALYLLKARLPPLYSVLPPFPWWMLRSCAQSAINWAEEQLSGTLFHQSFFKTARPATLAAVVVVPWEKESLAREPERDWLPYILLRSFINSLNFLLAHLPTCSMDVGEEGEQRERERDS